ncbi:hypothetical protein [Saccharolobus caldissimus]|uniref:Quinol oxidase (SoxABC), cytochrome b subunit, C-terminal part (SoxC) n=1 Tax=Saccharolobus caldissimus TaxID=1702097 RepID=A0AAQ4CU19_9CREN|nr:hypothetical protein [Saccharolobus caldissimus]BDB99300.1 hypothetical protein SACC_23170 [Saccharolobus caldissimus]
MTKLGIAILALIFGATAFMAGFMAYNLLWDSVRIISMLVR